MKLRIVRNIHNESIRFFLDNEEIGSANHDEHGWSGMEAMQNVLLSVASIVGWEVVEEER